MKKKLEGIFLKTVLHCYLLGLNHYSINIYIGSTCGSSLVAVGSSRVAVLTHIFRLLPDVSVLVLTGYIDW